MPGSVECVNRQSPGERNDVDWRRVERDRERPCGHGTAACRHPIASASSVLSIGVRLLAWSFRCRRPCPLRSACAAAGLESAGSPCGRRHRARRARDPSKPGTRGCRRARARGYAGFPETSASLQRTHSASARTERSKPASWRCRPRSVLTLHPPFASFSFGQSSCRIPGRHGQRRHPSSARRCALRQRSAERSIRPARR